MNEEMRYILKVETQGAEAAAQQTGNALQRVGQVYNNIHAGVQNTAKATQQTLENIVSFVRSAATQMQNQYNGMSPEKLSNEFTRLEERITKQQVIVAQANQELEEYAALWDQIAASGARTAGTADQDAQLAQLAQSANKAAAELKELQAAQQQVAAAMVNNTQYTQQMDIARQKTAQTKMGIDAMAFSIATVGRATGGTAGQIIMLAQEVRYLKQAFTATAAEAGKMGAAINASLGVIGIIIMAITIAVNAISKAEEEAKQKAKELREEISKLRSDTLSASELVAEYEALSKKIVRTADDTKRMVDIRAELVDQYGFSVTAIDDEGRLLAGNLEIMKEQLAISRQLTLAKLQENDEAEIKAYNEAIRTRIEQTDELALKEGYLNHLYEERASGLTTTKTHGSDLYSEYENIDDVIRRTESKIYALRNSLGEDFDVVAGEAQSAIDNLFYKMILEIEAHNGEVPDAIQAAVKAKLSEAYLSQEDWSKASDDAQAFIDAYFAIDANVIHSKVNSIENMTDQIIAAMINSGQKDTAAAADYVNGILDTLFSGADEAAYTRAEELKARIYDGLASPDEKAEYDDLTNQIRSNVQIAVDNALNQIEVPEDANIITKALAGIRNTINSIVGGPAADAITEVGDAYGSTAAEIQKMADAERALERQEARTQRSLDELNDVLDDFETGGSAAVGAAKDLADKMRDIGQQKKAIEILDDTASSADDMKKAMDTLKGAGFDESQITDDLKSVRQAVNDDEAAFITLLSTIAASAGVTFDPDTSQFASIQGDADATAVKIANVLNWLKGLDGAGLSMGGDGKIDAVIPKDIIKTTSGGGGGGGSKNKALQNQLDLLDRYRALDQQTTAEEIASLERIRAKYAKTAAEKQDIDEKLYALRKQLREDELEHQTALDQLTLREQIAIMDDMIAGLKEGTDARRELEKERYQAVRELEKQEYDLKVYYGQLTLEEQEAALKELIATYKEGVQARIDLEKELYDVQKQMKQRDIDNLNGLVDAVTDALKERYETQRQAEEDTLNASIKAWQNWGKEQVAAIQAQIDAIDALTKAENDAEVEAEKRAKIARLEQLLQYEQDAYNKRKLAEQLTAAQDDLNKWLRDKEREALKASLRERIDTVNTTVDEQTDALEEQIKANDAYYDELTKAQNLQAEAQRLIMQSSQAEIIDLLKAFAPEYNATGQTLGEQLVDGFMSQVGDIEAWFKNLTAGLTAYQQQMAAVATAAADQFYAVHGIPAAEAPAQATGPVTNVGPTINVYFTEQRDYTPSEIRRELERMIEQISQL